MLFDRGVIEKATITSKIFLRDDRLNKVVSGRSHPYHHVYHIFLIIVL